MDEIKDDGWVWVFVGAGARFPAAVFSSRAEARDWIRTWRVSGILTAYPLNRSHYDWACETGKFVPKNDEQKTAIFVQRFSSGFAPHEHFENGESE